MKYGPILILSLVALACDTDPKGGKGLRLPDGDLDRGRAAFVALNCHSCHSVKGVQLPKIEGEKAINVTLGGEVLRVRTYGDLVTSIVNPSHSLAKGYPAVDVSVGGKSKMPDYNDVMTVNQLIDLVSFLHSRYKLKPLEDYDYYWMQ